MSKHSFQDIIDQLESLDLPKEVKISVELESEHIGIEIFKPTYREWFIGKEGYWSTRAIKFDGEEAVIAKGQEGVVHVIEKKAYDKMKEERDEALKKIAIFHVKCKELE